MFYSEALLLTKIMINELILEIRAFFQHIQFYILYILYTVVSNNPMQYVSETKN